MLDETREIARLYRAGHTIKEIQQIMRVGSHVVNWSLRQADVPRRTAAARKGIYSKVTHEQVERIVTLYEGGMCVREIAARESLCMPTVDRLLAGRVVKRTRGKRKT